MPCREVLCLCGNRTGKLTGSWLRAGVFVCALDRFTDWYTSADRGSSRPCGEIMTLLQNFSTVTGLLLLLNLHPGELKAVRCCFAFSQSQSVHNKYFLTCLSSTVFLWLNINSSHAAKHQTVFWIPQIVIVIESCFSVFRVSKACCYLLLFANTNIS